MVEARRSQEAYHEKDYPDGDAAGQILAIEEEALNKLDSDITRLRMRES